MHDLTPQDYQRIINTWATQKMQAELSALEWKVRYEATTRDTTEGEDVVANSE